MRPVLQGLWGLLFILILASGMPEDVQANGRDDHGRKASIYGPVLVADSSGLQIGPITFMVTDSTEIEEEPFAPGDWVEIRFRYDSTATKFIALEIEREDDDGDTDVIRVEGWVTDREDSTLFISGIPIYVTASTILRGDENLPLSLEDVSPGQEMRAHVWYQADTERFIGILLKVEEEAEEENNGSSKRRKLEGVVVAIGPDFMEVALDEYGDTLRVQVPPGVPVRGEHGEKLTFADVEIGASVEVRVVRRMDGTLVAVAIEIEDPYEARDFKVVGLLVRVDSTHIFVNNHRFILDPAIEIEDQEGNELTLADLQVGSLVRVKGYVQRVDTSVVLVATDIRVLPPRRTALGREHRLRGVFTGVNGDTLFIEGIGLVLSDRTRFKEFSDVEELTEGEPVAGYFHLDDAGNRIAILIKKKDELEEAEMRGVVDTVGVQSLGIAGISFMATDTTVIRGKEGAPLTWADIQQGMFVRVRFVRTDAGYVATRIRVRRGFEVSAQVSSVMQGPTDLVLALPTQDIHVNTETVILGPQGEILDQTSLTSGAFVHVLAVEETVMGKVRGTQLTAERVQVLSGVATATEERTQPLSVAEVKAYPNPFTDYFTLTISPERPGEVRITLYDLLGREVERWQQVVSTQGPVHITLRPEGPLAPGIYFFQIETPEGRQTGKLVHVR